MKKLPVSLQTFSKLIRGNYLYVDKTQYIFNLLTGGGEYFFLSRPRRFGKSLLISTLYEIFSGNKELFKGLWIYDKIEWTQHPVIHIDCSKLTFKTPETLEKALENHIEEIAALHDIQLNPGLFLKEKFGKLLEELSRTQRVVILLDEYDRPLIEYIEKEDAEKAEQIRGVLKDFYSIIKGSDEFIRFVFITGVSKFSKVSVFSDLNNLRDITLSRDFAAMLGYTGEELERYFGPYMERLARETGMDGTTLDAEVRRWYNGYSWDGKQFVYNPFSILSLLTENSFKNYWFSTGTPTFLIKAIRERHDQLVELENLPVLSFAFDGFDIDNMSTEALLFQTGYLTIKKIVSAGAGQTQTYYLSYPNHEVRDSLLTYLLGEYTKKDLSFGARMIGRIGKAATTADIEGFIGEIKAFFASIPHYIFVEEREAYYHSLVYLLLRLTGVSVNVEEATNRGRIDAVMETDTHVTVMEFKMGSAKEALDQIKRMGYHEKYLNRGKKILLLGVGLDRGKRNIGDYLVEQV